MHPRLQLPDRADDAANSPAHGLEVISGSSDKLRLIEGDNLAALEALLNTDVQVHLAYLDPPFYTQRVHHRTKRHRNRRTGKLKRSQTPAFDDRWADMSSYLVILRERIIRIRELLTDDGCIIIHVDPTTSHYIKVLCDELFGADCFASEIIWRYRRWPAKTPNFQRMHDVLLRYRRNAKAAPRFCQLYQPLAASTRATWGNSKQLADVGEDGRRIRSTKTAEPSPGAPMGDVWEIGVIAPVAKERTGYPTQKPLSLLSRVIQSCSFEGDTVLDPYVGSGTTLLAAANEGRRAIGIDRSPEATQICVQRLTEAQVPYRHEQLIAQAVPQDVQRPAHSGEIAPSRCDGA